MPLVVQNEQGTESSANGYVTVVEFTTYHVDRGREPSDFDNEQIEAAIVKATDYIDGRFNYVGYRLSGREQLTEWPRGNAYDRYNYAVVGIPNEVKEACNEYAWRALTTDLNPDPLRDDSGALVQSRSEKVGPLTETVSFATGASFKLPRYPEADQKLSKAGLIRRGGELRRG